MNAQKFVVISCVLGFAAGLTLGGARVFAQGIMEQNAAMNMNDNLNGGGGAGGGLNTSYYMGKAQGAVQNANGMNNAMMNGMNGSGGMAPNGNMMQPGMPGQTGTPAGPQGITAQQAQQLTQAASAPKITVIAGTRVFDFITGELIDDAIRKKVPESEKSQYYDDGTHGDMIAGDEIYTRIDGEKRDVIGASNQKVKEQLIQALRVADGYTPVEFYGFSLMSTDRTDPLPRNAAWKVVKDPKGIGYMLSEEPVAAPLSVPKFRDKLKEKDHTVKDDWSNRFLAEYRKKKDDLSSEFYTVYIPNPPQPPSVVPPVGWTPFSDPGSLAASKAANSPMGRAQQLGQGGGAGLGMAFMGGGGVIGGGTMGGGMMGGRGR